MKNVGNLIEYLREQYGITECAKINGPSGAFISFKKSDGTVATIPVGKKSQEGALKEYSATEIDDDNGGKMIVATVNNYTTEESLSF